MPKKRCDGTLGVSEVRWCTGCCQNKQHARNYSNREKCTGPRPICEGMRSDRSVSTKNKFLTVCSVANTAADLDPQPEPKRSRTAPKVWEPDLLPVYSNPGGRGYERFEGPPTPVAAPVTAAPAPVYLFCFWLWYPLLSNNTSRIGLGNHGYCGAYAQNDFDPYAHWKGLFCRRCKSGVQEYGRGNWRHATIAMQGRGAAVPFGFDNSNSSLQDATGYKGKGVQWDFARTLEG